jgi:hypothetical protein
MPAHHGRRPICLRWYAAWGRILLIDLGTLGERATYESAASITGIPDVALVAVILDPLHQDDDVDPLLTAEDLARTDAYCIHNRKPHDPHRLPGKRHRALLGLCFAGVPVQRGLRPRSLRPDPDQGRAPHPDQAQQTDCQGLDQQVAVIRGERIQPDMLRVYSRRVDLFRMVGSGRKETLCFGNQHAEVPFAARQRCWIA